MAQLVTAHAVPVTEATGGQNINANAARQYLQQHNWPHGLTNLMLSDLGKSYYHFFIVDDSGSMAHGDGNMLKQTSRGLHSVAVNCTRWSEMVEAIKFHAGFANAANAPCEFRLLNHGSPITVGAGPDSYQNTLALDSLLNGSPGGRTPICKHIQEVVRKIVSMEQELRQSGQSVIVTIFTDGRATDGDVSAALGPLSKLPVRLVIRLCTDDTSIVDYWNGVDENLEVHMDCLDDLFGENDEVRSVNRWLTYGLPLHRIREFGCHLTEFDLLDEAKLNDSQIRTVIANILGGDIANYPYLAMGKDQFFRYVKARMEDNPMAMCPEKKQLKPWIRMHHLPGGRGSCTIF